MPDWSYHTLIGPATFLLSPEAGRTALLGALDTLRRVPGGLALVDLLGQMRPPAALRTLAGDLALPAPSMLSCEIDPLGQAAGALSIFGFGLLEVGPATIEALPASSPIERHDAAQELLLPAAPASAGLEALRARLGQLRPAVALAVRLGARPGASARQALDERAALIEALAPWAALFTLDWPLELLAGRWSSPAWASHVAGLVETLARLERPVPLWLCLPSNLSADQLDAVMAPAVEAGLGGVLLGGAREPDGRRRLGPADRERCAAGLCHLRERWGPRLTLAAGGVHEPGDALALRAAGADLLLLNSGLVFAGPGLPKRVNELLLSQSPAEDAALSAPGAHAPATQVVAAHAAGNASTEMRPSLARRLWSAPAWLWLALLGFGMVASGLGAALVAATLVVLPYDEAYVGLGRAGLAQLNPRLLPFMAHDRISLAGTMVAIGLLYLLLALQGVRRGWRWAWTASMASAGLGFASFFLFLGFGYFDPLHAVLSLALLVFYLGALRAPPRAQPRARAPDLRNDAAWRAGLWGQLLFVGLGAGLMLSGLTIAYVGVTSVFVPEDLAFLRTTSAALSAANQRLIPLIAHDRAGFGGALVASGLCVLLVSLWGFRRGEVWVWWTLLVAGLPGFVAALAVHQAVGYLDLWHLTPALLGAAVFLLALALARPFLCPRGAML